MPPHAHAVLRASCGASTSGRGGGGEVARVSWPQRPQSTGRPVAVVVSATAAGDDAGTVPTAVSADASISVVDASGVIAPSSASESARATTPPATIAALMKTALASPTMPDILKRRLLKLGAERGLDWGGVIADAGYTPAADWTAEALPPVSVTVNVSVDVPVDGLGGSGGGAPPPKSEGFGKAKAAPPKKGFGAAKAGASSSSPPSSSSKSKPKPKAAAAPAAAPLDTSMPVALRAALSTYSDGLYAADDATASAAWAAASVLGVLVDKDMEGWIAEAGSDDVAALAVEASAAVSTAASVATEALAAERKAAEERERAAIEAANAAIAEKEAEVERLQALRAAELEKMQQIKADLDEKMALLAAEEARLEAAVAAEREAAERAAAASDDNADAAAEAGAAAVAAEAGAAAVAAEDAADADDGDDADAVAVADDDDDDDDADAVAADDDDDDAVAVAADDDDDADADAVAAETADAADAVPTSDPSTTRPPSEKQLARGRQYPPHPVHWRKAVGYVAPALRHKEATDWKAAGVLVYTFSPTGELMVLLGRTVIGGAQDDVSNKAARRRSWNLLGGKRCARDATPEATALREVMEETGGLLTPDMLRGPLSPVIWYPAGSYAVFPHCLPPGETAWSLPERFEARRRVGRVSVSAGRDTANLEWVKLSSLVQGRVRLHIFITEMLAHTRLLEWLLQRQAERTLLTDRGYERARRSGHGDAVGPDTPHYRPPRRWLADLAVGWAGPGAPSMPTGEDDDGGAWGADDGPTARWSENEAWRVSNHPGLADDRWRAPPPRRPDAGDDRRRSRQRPDQAVRQLAERVWRQTYEGGGRWDDDGDDDRRRRRPDDAFDRRRRGADDDFDRRRPYADDAFDRRRRDVDEYGRRRRAYDDDDDDERRRRRRDDDAPPRRRDDDAPPRRRDDDAPRRRVRRDGPPPPPPRRYWDDVPPTATAWATNAASWDDDDDDERRPPPRRGDRSPPRRRGDDGGGGRDERAWPPPPARGDPYGGVYDPYGGDARGRPQSRRRAADPARTPWADPRSSWVYSDDSDDDTADAFYEPRRVRREPPPREPPPREPPREPRDRPRSRDRRPPRRWRYDDDDERPPPPYATSERRPPPYASSERPPPPYASHPSRDRWSTQNAARGAPPMLPLPPEVTTRPPLEPVEWEEQDSLHRPVKKRMDRGRAAPPAPTNGLGAAAAASFLPRRKKKGGE